MYSLMAAYGVGWAVIMLYLLTLAARQRKLSETLQRMQLGGEERRVQ
ncbi:MAG TPA: CcmD family protein [Terriglobales bacterium]|nr:CcmD family protein [Terriglobales bacterium]